MMEVFVGQTRTVFLGTTFVALLALAQVDAGPQSVPASIDGVVTVSGSGEPISGAVVQVNLIGGGADPQMTVATDSAGRFAFPSIAPGTYRLVASTEGPYVATEYGQRSQWGPGTPITLAAGQRMSQVQLAMLPTGSISGRVVDEHGEPLGRVQIQALKATYERGVKSFTILQTMQTDDLGQYRLFWLPPGAYYLAAKPYDGKLRSAQLYLAVPGSGSSVQQATSPTVIPRLLDTGEIIEEALVSVYYPGTTNVREMTSVAVGAGQKLSGVNFALTVGRVRAHRIRGVVVDGSTGRSASSRVMLLPRQLSANPTVATTNTNENGAFEIVGIVPGSYVLRACANVSPGGPAATGPIRGARGVASLSACPSASIAIEIGDADMENLTVVVRPRFSLSGRVILEGKIAGDELRDQSRVRVVLREVPAAFPPAFRGSNNNPADSGLVSADGTFVLSTVSFEHYEVDVSLPTPSSYIKSIALGARDVLADGLDLVAPPEALLEIRISLEGGAVDGRVVDARRQPVPNVAVGLVPEPSRRTSSYLYKSAYTDLDGQFRFQGIAPGNYTLFAWEEIEKGAWQDPDFLMRFDNRGRRIRVSEGSHENADVTLIPFQQ